MVVPVFLCIWGIRNLAVLNTCKENDKGIDCD